ncbi:hypothetical protein [Nonomuraea sp. NPDC050310]|uniref:hypothetical protein n=1 Tax=unclassified Nonomuraea TaxID=2593643 RepID=UPI0033C7148C
MRIRIEGTEAEIAYAVARLRATLPIGTVSNIAPVSGRPYARCVYLNTAPAQREGWWSK